jgi:uncharacterized protein (DUF58 family)
MPSSATATSDAALLREAERLLQLLDAASTGRRAEGGAFGQHQARRPGGAQEFWQYRRYGTGDPAQVIDWRRSARGQALYVRERERDVPRSYRLLVDGAAGMQYASTPALPQKCDVALVLALALAARALAVHEAVALQDLPPRRLAHLPTLLAEARWRKDFCLWQSAAGAAVTCQLLITDLLQPLEQLVAGFRHWGVQGRHSVVVALSDPAEAAYPFAGRLRFEGTLPASPSVVFGRAEAVTAAYHTARTAHFAAAEAAARACGWHWLAHTTGQPLLPLLQEIAQRWDTLI